MDIIGYIAAFCTTFAFLPQVIRTIKTKNTFGISLGMYSLTTIGLVFWLVYGIQIDNLPMIIANSVTLLLAAVVLTMKIKDVLTGS